MGLETTDAGDGSTGVCIFHLVSSWSIEVLGFELALGSYMNSGVMTHLNHANVRDSGGGPTGNPQTRFVLFCSEDL